MQPIHEHDFNLLADAARRRRRATCPPDLADALEQHAFRVMGFADDLAEGESVNGLDYQVLRAAAILHDVAAAKARRAATPDVSAALAEELLRSIGADEPFVSAVATAVRRHAGSRSLDEDGPVDCEDLETCPEMIVHDACLLARIEEHGASGGDTTRAQAAVAALCTRTARRIAAAILDSHLPAAAAIG